MRWLASLLLALALALALPAHAQTRTGAARVEQAHQVPAPGRFGHILGEFCLKRWRFPILVESIKIQSQFFGDFAERAGF